MSSPSTGDLAVPETAQSGAIPEFESRDSSTELVVLLHAFASGPHGLRHVRDVVREDFPEADIFVPRMLIGRFSMALPSDVIAEVLMRIDALWATKTRRGSEGYRRILLVGHSMGALYARKLYVCACGENREAPFEPELKGCLTRRNGEPLAAPRPWADRVERIVLLAGMNRGWSISHHLSLFRAVAWSLGVAMGSFMTLFYRRPPIIFTIRKGAPFITQLRIQWLAMRRQAAAGAKAVGRTTTIQLLGSVDDMVSPEDNVDLVAGRDFVYLDVPRSGHANVVEMDESEAGRQRRAVFHEALTASPKELEAKDVIPADSLLAERPDVTDVVFVIHGIRDQGYWTHKIARRAIAEGRRRGRVIASETSTYGYFPMLSFLWPRKRRAKVEWLMDQYAEALATYPNAEFSYVGHSNGTYLLARALQEYPSCRFKRVVFAGSVVRQRYDWSRFIPSQVQIVVNFVATADWVVAFFPKALQTLDVQDLGSAGHDGFEQGGAKPPVLQPVMYVIGGHSAALHESMWDSIARFVITGELVEPPASLLSAKQSWWVRYPAKVAWMIWVIIAVVLVLGLVWLLRLPLDEWLKTVLVLAYLAAIWTVLTRV